ncbi:MAG: MlaD family protein, partial [Verrucomicrobiota bacterium]
RYELTITLNDATGIIKGAPIRFGGTMVGRVRTKEISDDFTSMQLKVDIFEEYKLPKGSRFVVTTSGLMGDRFINITPPVEPTKERIQPGETIASSGGDMMAEFQERAARLSDKIEIVLEELDQAVVETRVVVANLTSVTEKVDQRVMSDDNLDNIAKSIEKLQVTTTNLADGSAKLEPLLEESRVTVAAAKKPFERATEVIDKIEPAVEELQPAFAELKPAIAEVRPTLIEMKDVATKANYAIDRIIEGEGVTGALISDADMRSDLESFVDNLEAHGILGYKKGKQKDDSKDSDDDDDDSDEDAPREKRGLFGKKKS